MTVCSRQLLDNIQHDPDSASSAKDKRKIDEILTNMMTKRGICELGKNREPEHPDRASFSKFIRIAQHKIFNPDRPKVTGIYFIIYL